MSICFDTNRWDRVKEVSTQWWAGELRRPLIQVYVYDRTPDREKPREPYQFYTAFHGLVVPAEDVVDTWDYLLSSCSFMGDAFPNIFPNFGPGIAAAFLGCELECGNDTIWFHPGRDVEIADLDISYDPDAVYFKRIKELCAAAGKRWNGQVQVSMTDIGGTVDILSSFRPGEKLLLDLYDHPEQTRSLIWKTHDAWWQYYSGLAEVLSFGCPGYSAWTPLYSSEPYYMLQCDFAYMISPDMFREFVLPELQASCKRLTNAFYHLDGPGQLPHLDMLLSIPELKGIQWIPGAGAPDNKCWPDVYRRIHESGKLIQVFGDLDVLDTVVEQIGTAQGIAYIGTATDRAEATALLDRYGALA